MSSLEIFNSLELLFSLANNSMNRLCALNLSSIQIKCNLSKMLLPYLKPFCDSPSLTGESPRLLAKKQSLCFHQGPLLPASPHWCYRNPKVLLVPFFTLCCFDLCTFWNASFALCLFLSPNSCLSLVRLLCCLVHQGAFCDLPSALDSVPFP